MGADCVRKIPGIEKPRSFELKKYKKKMGPDAVTVGMKEYMHSPRYSGLTAAGVFEGAAPSLFKGGIPAVENAPPFELQKVDSEVIRLIKMRHKALHSRVDALFPRGESRSFVRSRIPFTYLELTAANITVESCSLLFVLCKKSTLLKPFTIIMYVERNIGRDVNALKYI